MKTPHKRRSFSHEQGEIIPIELMYAARITGNIIYLFFPAFLLSAERLLPALILLSAATQRIKTPVTTKMMISPSSMTLSESTKPKPSLLKSKNPFITSEFVLDNVIIFAPFRQPSMEPKMLRIKPPAMTDAI